MAKDRKKVQHIHSSVFDKQPTPQSIELGELAVNNNELGSFISTKNSVGNVVRFSEDATIVDWMERKEVFPYSGSVLADLAENKSQILFSINQVAASGSPHYTNINGAVDMNNDPINPSQDGGYTDGAGFAVNMDIYAMQGGNPSFSSVTTTCGALLQGTTEIVGETGSCGSLLNIDVNIVSSTTEGDTIINSTSGDVCIMAAEDANLYGSVTTRVGVNCDDSATAETTTVKGETTVVDASDGNLGLTAKDDILESAENDIIITANHDVCETAGNIATFYGVEETKIGIDCACDNVSELVTVNGDKICIEGNDVYLYGGNETHIGVNCDGNKSSTIVYERNPKPGLCEITSTTVDAALDEVLDRATIGMSSTTVASGTTYTLYQDSGDCRNAFDIVVPAGQQLNCMTWEYGSVCDASGDTYCPNDLTKNSKIIIPSTLSGISCGHVVDNGNCISFDKDLCVDGKVEVTDGLYYSSDERLKENINDVDQSKLLNARKVNFKEFVFKDDETKSLKYGVIAQNVEANDLKEMIETREDGFKMVDYTSLMCLKIAYLENQVETLTNKLEELMNKLEK